MLTPKTRFAVFASGGGTNLQAVIDALDAATPGEVAVVISNNAAAGALDRARAAGIAAEVLSDPRDGTAILDVLARHRIDLVVLAGYLKLIPADVVAQYEDRMINIHPALLPAFGGPGMYGLRVHSAVLASGATVSGPTVHLVSPEYDRGRVLAQWPVPVLTGDTPERLAARVLEVEHRLLPAVVVSAAHTRTFRRLPFQTSSFCLGQLPETVLDAMPEPLSTKS